MAKSNKTAARKSASAAAATASVVVPDSEGHNQEVVVNMNTQRALKACEEYRSGYGALTKLARDIRNGSYSPSEVYTALSLDAQRNGEPVQRSKIVLSLRAIWSRFQLEAPEGAKESRTYHGEGWLDSGFSIDVEKKTAGPMPLEGKKLENLKKRRQDALTESAPRGRGARQPSGTPSTSAPEVHAAAATVDPVTRGLSDISAAIMGSEPPMAATVAMRTVQMLKDCGFNVSLTL